MPERIWRGGLSPAQADGQACVVCGRNFRVRGSVAVPVGRSSTGSQVFACVRGCADEAADLAGGLVVVPVEALTAAGAALLAALEGATAATPTGDPRHAWPDQLVAAIVHAAAPLIVAAELRRIAAEINTTYRAPELWPVYLRNRADELDPAGGGERR